MTVSDKRHAKTGFSEGRIAVFGVLVALFFVTTANISTWFMSNPPFVQATPYFSRPTSLFYLGNGVYAALLLIGGFFMGRAVRSSDRIWAKNFVRRISGMSLFQLFVVIIYAPVAINIIIQYSISMPTGTEFLSAHLLGGLLSWTISFFLFIGLAYGVGSAFRRTKK